MGSWVDLESSCTKVWSAFMVRNNWEGTLTLEGYPPYITPCHPVGHPPNRGWQAGVLETQWWIGILSNSIAMGNEPISEPSGLCWRKGQPGFFSGSHNENTSVDKSDSLGAFRFYLIILVFVEALLVATSLQVRRGVAACMAKSIGGLGMPLNLPEGDTKRS
jgi:hypothetical protein